jgi:hypothetical protein
VQNDVQNGIFDTDSESAVSETSTFMNPVLQRQLMNKLISEFKTMPNPLIENKGSVFYRINN